MDQSDALKATPAVSDNWHSFAESQFAWERDSLNFVKQNLPNHPPWHAWSNLEFTDDNGNIREVALLVFSPQGVFLVEIKNWRGVITGDDSYWHREYDGKRSTVDNPRRLANQKSKTLKSLLARQSAFSKTYVPYIEPLVFLGDERVRFDIQGAGAAGVALRDTANRPGIMAALKTRDCPGLNPLQGANLDKVILKAFNRALEQAGIRPSLHTRTIADYRLVKTIDEGPGWQDWLGEHTSLLNNRRRIRFYPVRDIQGREERELRERAARREYQLLESLNHPDILRAYHFYPHEIGPAVLLEYPDKALRLDHYLQQYGASIGESTRLHLLQKIAEVVHFAHRKQVVHRALSPHSILVIGPDNPAPGIRIMNWQTGSRAGSATAGHTISATSHFDVLVDDAAMAYLSPEVLDHDAENQEKLDVFSLGALAYLIFSGRPPADSHAELVQKLQADRSLLVTSVLNGASQSLIDLIRESTRSELILRMDRAEDFLAGIAAIENELTTPDNEYKGNPAEAPAKAILPGGYVVERRLGQGSSAVAYLVRKRDDFLILKMANHPQHNERLAGEHKVLKKLEGEDGIVRAHELARILDHAAIELEPTFADTNRDKPLIETLGQRLGREGRLHIDLLERFSDDLLGIVCNLEKHGVHHRDIKPDNIAVGQGEARRLHLTLFDFSLADTPPRNITAGTRRYLDPMLALKDRGTYDTAADRYAAAVTLYQMAAGIGSFPVWGDGQSDAALLPPSVSEATINPELFEGSLRDGLARFFKKAFQRDLARRHHNSQEMRHHWNECLASLQPGTPDPTPPDSEESAEALANRLAGATWDTILAELGLSQRALNALDRFDMLKVRDLLVFPVFRLQRLPGVGSKTRREINDAWKILRDKLGMPAEVPVPEPIAGRKAKPREIDPETCSLEQAVDSLLQKIPSGSREVARLFLGLDDPANPWPLQSTIARQKSLTNGRIGQIVVEARKRWSDHPVTRLVAPQIAELLGSEKQGGVMMLDEMAEVLVAQRGGTSEAGRALPLARALVRAAMEVESNSPEPRFLGRRGDNGVVLAVNEELAKLAFRLGHKADELAGEDPLLNPRRALEQLRQVVGDKVPLHDNRLPRLAAAASSRAALSTTQEIYPRGMAAVRALRLAQGAWLGTRNPTAEQIRERVFSRYPLATLVPGRPELDGLLREAGIPLTWDEHVNGGHGGYMGPASPNSFSAASSSLGRMPTNAPNPAARSVSPGVEAARLVEDRLGRSRGRANFLTLMVDPRLYSEARAELVKRFQAVVIDLEEHFLVALRATADKLEVPWPTVVQADAKAVPEDWLNLLALAREAVPAFESSLMQACRQAAPRGPDQTDRALLVVQPGLLSRYGQMNQLDKLAELAGKRDGLPAVWLLLGGDQAMVDGQAVPLINASQKLSINEEWITNIHRA